VKDGLYFVGLDLIGGKLIEVNVLSPGGIVNINRLNKARLQKRIIDFCDDMVKYKETASGRRNELRKSVLDA
jgi:glutathione synthase